MCEYCGGIREHEVGCPLFDYSAFPKCTECNGAIIGKHYNINGNVFHIECIEHLRADEILKLAGISLTDFVRRFSTSEILEICEIEVTRYVE